jgi:hypothetical protein
MGPYPREDTEVIQIPDRVVFFIYNNIIKIQ